jgi:hypothetical protein
MHKTLHNIGQIIEWVGNQCKVIHVCAITISSLMSAAAKRPLLFSAFRWISTQMILSISPLRYRIQQVSNRSFSKNMSVSQFFGLNRNFIQFKICQVYQLKGILGPILSQFKGNTIAMLSCIVFKRNTNSNMQNHSTLTNKHCQFW